jgi:hypothetical protein
MMEHPLSNTVTEGDMPFSLLGTCAPVAYTPHARVSAAQGNFSCHSSMFLVYSRCAFRRDPTVTDFALPWHHRQRGRGAAMTFEEMLDQAMAMLQRRRRVTYRALTLQFSLDDDHLEALKDEILYAHPHVVDDDGRGLIWTGEVLPTSTPGSPLAIDQARAPLSYTPSHLAEKILTSKSALEGERKQVTVLFADLKGSLELLAGRPAPAPGNYRPEYQHSWGGRTYYTQLRLDPLTPERAEELLGALLGPDAGLEPLTRVLIARTEGNPFFLEESVRALVETGSRLGERGAYRLARPLPTIQVPATVQAVLAARIDRLPPQEKRLLQAAAVIGTDVPFLLLQALGEIPEATLHGALAHLQAAEFLYETRLFPEIEYTFKHAFTQQVAYESLLQERRRSLHARIVEALEALVGERVAEQVERLAHHALLGAVWDKALAYSRQAGEKAIARSAYREAMGYFERRLAPSSICQSSAPRASRPSASRAPWRSPQPSGMSARTPWRTNTSASPTTIPWGRRSCWPAARRRRMPSPSARWRSPVHTRNGATKRMPYASSARLRCSVSLRNAICPKRTTVRPSPWPRS